MEASARDIPVDPTALMLNEAAVRLLAEALVPDDGRGPKVKRLCDGLCEIVGAQGWFWVRSRLPKDSGPPVNIDFLYGGEINETELAIWSERSLEVRGVPPNKGLSC